jgi:hypothetical protein
MRPRRRLGVVLHGKHRQAQMFDPFDSIIIKVPMCYDNVFPRQTFFSHGKTVVLSGDVNPAVVHIFDRVVNSPVTELHLVSIRSQGQSGNLVINNRLYAVSRALANVLKPEIDLAETYFWKFGVPYPWTDQERVFPLDTVAVVIDFESGKRFRAQFLDGDNHADCQTLTAADTAIYKEIYGGVWSWERRAVILQAHGYRLAASMIGQPHGAGSIPDNELPGHFCIHFLGSRTHAGAALDQKHQEMVLKAAGKKVFREDKYPEEANN